MYKAVVRLLTRRTYRQLSAGDLERFMSVFGADAEFCFVGGHALGGRLLGREAIREVIARMLRLFLDLSVTPRKVVVNGWPWRTVVAVELSVSASLPDGSRYLNQGMQSL